MASRKSTSAFTPLPWSLSELKAVVPERCFERDLSVSLLFIGRHVLISGAAGYMAAHINDFANSYFVPQHLPNLYINITRWGLWSFYFFFQSLMFTGLWFFGHECIHNAISRYRQVDDVIGFLLLSFVGTPYYSWQFSHGLHHAHRAHAEKEPAYVPETRSSIAVPGGHDHAEYIEHFEDAPLYTLGTLIIRQFIGFPLFLLGVRTDNRKADTFICHFLPPRGVFKHRYNGVIISDIGLIIMGYLLLRTSQVYGLSVIVKYYGIPWVLLNNWIVLITYLHHTAPKIPYYRGKAWSFLRGALSTVDRNLLGEWGRFFFLNAAHCHVAHHLFPQIPWHHLPEATKHLKAFLGDHYVYSDEPAFKALWRSYTQCQYIDDEGDVVFYRNTAGESAMKVAME
ncbi:hypothetical protein SISSUDRAFT_1042409 [Sistotremastrum suecicum HHB10207 ss-3]|uniref:Fatty acid desaturase domain-containing protein n=1 Tax=Sistotremastrum suecicum HHB10207 ss-3 TaxID=1314776 RepID=A0A166GFX7_9AGAM|nr:hypothetical protein SISSUDRAFT_1042409 [Sistotremastrum suecicum HHB10207 ss-3]